MPMQVFALVWSKNFVDSCPLPAGSDPRPPATKKLELAAGDKSLFVLRPEAEKHCNDMNADYPHLNDRPVEVVPLELQ